MAVHKDEPKQEKYGTPFSFDARTTCIRAFANFDSFFRKRQERLGGSVPGFRNRARCVKRRGNARRETLFRTGQPTFARNTDPDGKQGPFAALGGSDARYCCAVYAVPSVFSPRAEVRGATGQQSGSITMTFVTFAAAAPTFEV